MVSTGIFWAMNYFWLKLRYVRPVPVLPLACMNSEMPVQLIRSCELPGAARPGAQVGLVTYVPPQVRPQVGSFLEIIFTNDARKCYLYRILLCKLSHSLDNDRDAWWGHLNKKYGLSSIFCYSALLSSGHKPNMTHIVTNPTQRQHNLNCSWVWHENDFLHHPSYKQKLKGRLLFRSLRWTFIDHKQIEFDQ